MISRIQIGVDACRTRAPIFEAICAARAEYRSDTSCWLPFSSAAIELTEEGPRGIQAVDVHIEDVESALDRLGHSEINHRWTENEICIDASEASGLLLKLSGSKVDSPDTTSRIDHIALRVFDLDQSTRRWEAILGVAATDLGVHPVSQGAFEGTRLPIEDQMIELLAPVPGVDSAISKRLQSHGEGVAALAIPSRTVDATRRRLEELGVEALWRDPHWMVHPRDCAGVLLQLTPRVGH